MAKINREEADASYKSFMSLFESKVKAIRSMNFPEPIKTLILIEAIKEMTSYIETIPVPTASMVSPNVADEMDNFLAEHSN